MTHFSLICILNSQKTEKKLAAAAASFFHTSEGSISIFSDGGLLAILTVLEILFAKDLHSAREV